ncbi:MAG: hypothetical protein QW534_05755 [Candidatus Methanomethylicia archaeon]
MRSIVERLFALITSFRRVTMGYERLVSTLIQTVYIIILLRFCSEFIV